MSNYKKWDYFRVKKRFTLFPLRIYQYTSQTTWWSWFETTYILQVKRYPSEKYKRGIIGWFNAYFYGFWWSNERIASKKEYLDYKSNTR